MTDDIQTNSSGLSDLTQVDKHGTSLPVSCENTSTTSNSSLTSSSQLFLHPPILQYPQQLPYPVSSNSISHMPLTPISLSSTTVHSLISTFEPYLPSSSITHHFSLFQPAILHTMHSFSGPSTSCPDTSVASISSSHHLSDLFSPS